MVLLAFYLSGMANGQVLIRDQWGGNPVGSIDPPPYYNPYCIQPRKTPYQSAQEGAMGTQKIMENQLRLKLMQEELRRQRVQNQLMKEELQRQREGR